MKRVCGILFLIFSLNTLFGCASNEPVQNSEPFQSSEEIQSSEASQSSEVSQNSKPSQNSNPTQPSEPVQNAELFHNDASGIYNYCPSVMQTDENTRYVYYCTNTDDYVVIDHIACRKGIRQQDGTFLYGEEKIVLSPTPKTWDAQHTCDPTVIKGEFSYRGEMYSYLMAYLGCVTTNNQENMTGIALAKEPDGKWIKVDSINPVVPYIRDESQAMQSAFQWGNGQPSLVSVDKKGTVWLIYTLNNGVSLHVIAEKWDFSKMESARKLEANTVTIMGLRGIDNLPSALNNADFCYDPSDDSFYAVSECGPYPTDAEPSFISAAVRVAKLSSQSGNPLSDTDRKSRWKTLLILGENETGFPRNHNPGFVTDAYGWRLDDQKLELVYTMSELGEGHVSKGGTLWGYRLHTYYFEEE